MKHLLFIFAAFYTLVITADIRIINGKPVGPGEYTEVVSIRTSNAGCTATIIGPRAMLTAAHCARTGSTSVFSINGVQYSATITRHPGYPMSDWDIALGLVNKDVVGIKPATIHGGSVFIGDRVNVLGFGCTQPGGGPSDGVLRIGSTVITGFSTYDIISKESGGAALCYGDSGGPVFIDGVRGYRQVAVNSKGNIQDTNYTTNLTLVDTQDFLKKWAADNSTEICGINKVCDGGPGPDVFVLENKSVKATVENKGIHDSDYLKVYFGYLLSFLESERRRLLPLPKDATDVPRGFCNCGSGWMASCNERGYGECSDIRLCMCEGSY